MELRKVKELLVNYEEGTTSLIEEKMLQDYFLSDHVDPELVSYKPLFRLYEQEYNQHFEAAPRAVKSSYLKWVGIAASFIIILSVFIMNDFGTTNDLGTYEDPEIALQQTKEVLKMVGSYMNEGTEQLSYINEIEQTGSKIIK